MLAKVGFREEGLLKRYLDVDGACGGFRLLREEAVLHGEIVAVMGVRSK